VTTPADELRAAAETLRSATFRGAMTATPAVAALVRAREPLAAWLDECRADSVRLHSLFPDADGQSKTNPHALAVARAILGGGQP
jgi:hypothetical protein